MSTRTPASRADFTGVGCNVLSGFHLAQQFGCVAADAAVMDFTGHNLAFGVDHEGAAFGKTGFFDHDAEVAADYARGVTHHREAHFADSRARTVPGHVREVCVRGYGIDFNAALLKLFVVLGEIFEFGRADEREICRIEEDDGPLAVEIGFGNVDEVAILESGGLERENFGAKNGHRRIPYKKTGFQTGVICGLLPLIVCEKSIRSTAVKGVVKKEKADGDVRNRY